MSLSDADLTEIRVTAGNRWPNQAEIATSRATWEEWRTSFTSCILDDVMWAVIALSETHEWFPSLATFLEVAREQRDARRVREMPKIEAPKERRPSREQVLAAYSASVIAGYTPGPYERKAMEMLAAGVDPGAAARAFVSMWTDPPGGQPKGLARVGYPLPPEPEATT